MRAGGGADGNSFRDELHATPRNVDVGLDIFSLEFEREKKTKKRKAFSVDYLAVVPRCR